MQPATIVAEMADGWTIVEYVEAFEDFTAIVLAFRRDSECVRLTWHETPEPPEPVLYDHAGQCPWNRAEDGGDEPAEAEYRRWGPSAGDALGRAIRRLYWADQRGRVEGVVDQEAA